MMMLISGPRSSTTRRTRRSHRHDETPRRARLSAAPGATPVQDPFNRWGLWTSNEAAYYKAAYYFTILMIRSIPSWVWLRPSWVSMKQTST
jgi:hypothetical protein